jgi:hypothetical protein
MDAVWPVRLMGDWPKPLFVALLGLSPATLLPCLSQGHHRAALAVALRTRLASPTAALDAEANPVGRPSGIALAVRTSLTARAAVLGCRCRSLGSILWQAQATAPGVACATAARSDVNSTRAGACVQPAPRADNKSCRGQRSSAAAASSRPLSARSHLGAGVCVLCEGCLSAAARARPGPFPGREGNTPRLRKKVRSSRAGSCCCMLLAAGREKRELLAACPRAGWPRARARARPPWPPPPPAGWCCCLLPARDDPAVSSSPRPVPSLPSLPHSLGPRWMGPACRSITSPRHRPCTRRRRRPQPLTRSTPSISRSTPSSTRSGRRPRRHLPRASTAPLPEEPTPDLPRSCRPRADLRQSRRPCQEARHITRRPLRRRCRQDRRTPARRRPTRRRATSRRSTLGSASARASSPARVPCQASPLAGSRARLAAPAPAAEGARASPLLAAEGPLRPT